MVNPRESADAARLLYLRGKRQDLARRILSSTFRWSPSANLIWYVRDHMAAGELIDLALRVSRNRHYSFLHHGPVNQQTGEKLDEEVAMLWMRTSLQMHYLCGGNQTQYLHVLQPNQYVLNSKPLHEKEYKVCFDPRGETVHVVRRLFPKLQQKGQELVRKGVQFLDLTQVFSRTEEPIYVDPWCHFNNKGNQIVGEAIAAHLLTMLDQPLVLP